jgi:luciferase family oxidoreductase group 1
MSIPYSILDLSPIPQGFTATDALNNSRDLAQHAEKWGFTRYCVAAGTSTIRIGSGGIMLPNHAPLVVAEQFGTLASLFPGRIELGLGRAPGTDQMTARALRRDLQSSSDQFPQDVQELQFYFDDVQPGQAVKAIPGAGLHVPIWILGSSTYGAQVAAHFGLPYAFASHFAPEALMQALHAYKSLFKPSSQQAKPHAGVGVNIVAADTDEQARYLFTTHQQHATRMRRNTRGQLPPPIDDIETFWTPYEKVSVSEQLSCSVVGSPETVRRGLQALVDKTGADELIMAGQIFDHKARLHSFEIAAQAAREVNVPTALAA